MLLNLSYTGEFVVSTWLKPQRYKEPYSSMANEAPVEVALILVMNLLPLSVIFEI